MFDDVIKYDNPLTFAAELVRCDDDTPEAEVAVRCHAANHIKRLVDVRRNLRTQLAKADAEVQTLQERLDKWENPVL